MESTLTIEQAVGNLAVALSHPKLEVNQATMLTFMSSLDIVSKKCLDAKEMEQKITALEALVSDHETTIKGLQEKVNKSKPAKNG